MALRPVRGEILGSSDCSFAEAGRLLRIFLAARKELIMDAPDTFAQLLAVRQSLEHLEGPITATRQAGSGKSIGAIAQRTPSEAPQDFEAGAKKDRRNSKSVAEQGGRTVRTEAGKVRDSVGQAEGGTPAADALGSPASLEQQRKEEKPRRKEERRRQREETRGRDGGAPPTEAATAAPVVASAEAESNEEERKREEKRLRKEERRQKREVAANGVKAGGGEESEFGGGMSTSGRNQSALQGVSKEEEERRGAKEEKRRRKEGRKKAKELEGLPSSVSPPRVSAALGGAASTKRPAEELDADQKRAQKRANVDTSQVVSKRPREEENGLELERPVGKKQKGVETPRSSTQPNGMSAGMPDEEAARKEEKRRRKEQKRRAKETAEQPRGQRQNGEESVGKNGKRKSTA